MKSISIVVLTYNGVSLLRKNLPVLHHVAETRRDQVELIVVDNGSSDGTAEFLRDNFPCARMERIESNTGFAEAVNHGIYAAKHDIVLVISNDVLVGEDLFCDPVARFDDPDVFSVTPNMIDPRDGNSQAIPRLKQGICWFRTRFLQLADLKSLEGDIPIFYGSGGASFYDREKLLFLGGFDTIYHPFYVEDVDLGYRGWKAGWKCLLEPSVTVFHETSSTIRSLHKKRKIKFLGDRNRHLFLWLNVTDPYLIIRYLLFLPLSLLYDIVAFRKYKFVGFFRALSYLPQLPALRKKRKAYFKVTDREVFTSIC
jgi:GT2 family glycosyltransferase